MYCKPSDGNRPLNGFYITLKLKFATSKKNGEKKKRNKNIK